MVPEHRDYVKFLMYKPQRFASETVQTQRQSPVTPSETERQAEIMELE